MSTIIRECNACPKCGLTVNGLCQCAAQCADDCHFGDHDEQPTLTEEDAQLVIGAMPLQGLPNEPWCDGCHGYAHTSDCPAYKRSTRPEQPAPDAGEWRYVETAHAAEVKIGKLTLRPHWTGLSDTETIRATMKQIVRDHRLAVLVPELVEALRQVREAYNCGPSAERIRIAMDVAIDYVDAALANIASQERGK